MLFGAQKLLDDKNTWNEKKETNMKTEKIKWTKFLGQIILLWPNQSIERDKRKLTEFKWSRKNKKFPLIVF